MEVDFGQIPEKLEFLLSPSRYKVLYGGRGGAKSRGFGTVAVLRATTGFERILCCREIQKSIKDSVKRVIEDQIRRQKLENLYHITRDGITCKKTGSEFIFAGLRDNIDAIKSIEGITICWCEEAHTLSQYSLDTLEPTIRAEGSELWFSYNPKFETDPVHKMFVVDSPPPGASVVEVNWRDNPWFPEVLKTKMEWDKEKDFDKYLHVWEGKTVQFSDEQVLHGIWTIGETPEPPEGTQIRYGIDFGHGPDPCAGPRFYIEGRTIYITHEMYAHGVRIQDLPDLAKKSLPGIENWVSVADCSRPETIAYLNDNGLRVAPSKKGAGSIEDGVSRLRSFDIVINPRCKYSIEEFTKYSYERDKKTDEILPIIIDDFNHIIDPLRYATEGVDMPEGYISPEEIDHAMSRFVGEDGYSFEPKILSIVCFGSTSVLSCRQGIRLFEQRTAEGMVEADRAISDIVMMWSPQAIVIDISTGFGAALTARLRNQGTTVIDVNPKNSAGKYSDHKDIHSEMWWDLKQWLPLASIPVSSDLRIDLMSVTGQPTQSGSGNLVVEDIDSIGKRLGNNFLKGLGQSLAISFAAHVSSTQFKRVYTQAEKDWLDIINFSEGGQGKACNLED